MLSTIKEVKEFFLRNIPVTAGSKRDREVGYATTHIVGGSTIFNRFLKKNIPSEGVMSKFVHSVPFILNNEDTAKTTEQGLVKLASDANAGSRSNIDADSMSTVISPQQMLEVKPKTEDGNGDQTTPIDADYQIEVTEALQYVDEDGRTSETSSETDLGERLVAKLSLSQNLREKVANIQGAGSPGVTSENLYALPDDVNLLLLLAGTSPKTATLPRTTTDGRIVEVKVFYPDGFTNFVSLGVVNLSSDAKIDGSVNDYELASVNGAVATFKSIRLAYIEVTDGNGQWFILSERSHTESTIVT